VTNKSKATTTREFCEEGKMWSVMVF